MDSYRVKLKDGKIVGPINQEQIGKLYIKGFLDGQEECQNIALQEWKRISEFPELNLFLKDVILGNRPAPIEKPAPPVVFRPPAGESPSPLKTADSIPPAPEAPAQENFEKTIINTSLKNLPVKSKADLRFDHSNPINSAPSLEQAPVVVEKKVTEEVLDTDQKTVMFDIKKLKNEAEKPVSDATFLLEMENPPTETEGIVPAVVEKTPLLPVEPIPATVPEKIKKFLFTKNKTGMKPIILISFVVVFYFLLFDTDQDAGEIVVQPPVISFPMVSEVESAKESSDFFERGLKEYSKRSYISKVQAGVFFRKSLEHKFQNNPAIGNLVLTYAETFPNAQNKIEAGKVIARLMKISQNKLLSDVNLAVGVAKFYFELDKYHASLRVLENYVRVSKPSVKFMATYLEVLISAGELTKARNVFNKLLPMKDKTADVYNALAMFLFNDDNYKEAKKIVEEGGAQFPHSVDLLLNLAKIVVYEGDFKRLVKILELIKALGAESSRIYYAKYLEYVGVLSAVKNDQESAARYFKAALKLNESEELRSKLAALEIGGEKNSKSLILESKTLDLVQKAKNAIKNKNWERAFSFALEAADLSPSYVPANIVLAKIQMSQGYFNQAIKILNEVVNKNPQSESANFALVEAYIKAYKFEEAKKHLGSIAATKMGQSYRFPSLYGLLFYKDHKYLQSIKNYQKSVQRNPLSDEDFFQLANLYLHHRRYNRGKSYLLKAISLDPTNVEYRVKYASILYELEDTETAIGYLREVLETNVDDPIVLGEIAIYYYRSGQTKFFEEYRKKLETLDRQDRNLYEFLVKKAQLDDDLDKVIEYSKDLVKVDPSDLESKIKLGNIYIEKGNYTEAEKIFEDIHNRLDTFPRLLYYLAKIQFLKGNMPKAIELIKQEIAANPTLEDSYILLGDIYKKQESYIEAEENYKLAQLKNNKSVEALLGLAWIKYKRNHADAALDLYLKASSLAPRNAAIRKQLGHVYRALGQSALAIESFKVYLELNQDAEDKAQIEALINELR